MDPEDTRKLHAEINQITNQRFLITTSAIALFGVIGGWMIPKAQPASNEPVSNFICATCIMLIVVLLILFWYSLQLKRTLRVLTTYLDVVVGSTWESHWHLFRKTQKPAVYTSAQTTVFLILGLLATLFPVALTMAFSLPWVLNTSTCLVFMSGLIYVITVVALGFLNCADNEAEARRAWGLVKKAAIPPEGKTG